MNNSHLSRKHRLKLVFWIDAFDYGKQEI